MVWKKSCGRPFGVFIPWEGERSGTCDGDVVKGEIKGNKSVKLGVWGSLDRHSNHECHLKIIFVKINSIKL